MIVKVFPMNGTFTVCAANEHGAMDPDYLQIPDIKGKGTAHYIADRINEAYRKGRRDKAREIRKALED